MSGDGLDRALRELTRWDPRRPDRVDRSGLAIVDLTVAARSHRLTGVLAAAVEAGGLEVGPEEIDLVRHEHRAAMTEVLMLEDVLLDAVECFDRDDIDYRVLKGSALAHLVHPDPAHRSFGDNDLLVRSSQIDAAVEILVAAGGHRPVPALSADFDRRFAKSVTLGWRHGTELDLHRTLAPGPFGARIVSDDLWSRPRHFPLAAASIRTLPPELHFLHGAYHLVLGDTSVRYGNVRDLALMLEAGIDEDTVIATVERWRGEAVLAEAVAIMTALGTDVGPLGRWAAGIGAKRRDRRWLRTYETSRRRYRRQALAMMQELGWRDRIDYLRALARPAPDHRAARRDTGSGRAAPS